MRSSDWSSDVCSAVLRVARGAAINRGNVHGQVFRKSARRIGHRPGTGDHPDALPQRPEFRGWGRGGQCDHALDPHLLRRAVDRAALLFQLRPDADDSQDSGRAETRGRSEAHTSELQSLMSISYAVFFLKKKKTN